jgi:hypothetical protein
MSGPHTDREVSGGDAGKRGQTRMVPLTGSGGLACPGIHAIVDRPRQPGQLVFSKARAFYGAGNDRIGETSWRLRAVLPTADVGTASDQRWQANEK